MKKIISIFLIILFSAMILDKVSVQALSDIINEIKLENANSKDVDLSKNDIENNVIESEESTNLKEDEDKKISKEHELENEVEKDNKEVKATNKITMEVRKNGRTDVIGYDSLARILTTLNNAGVTSNDAEVTITFNENYTITSNDINNNNANRLTAMFKKLTFKSNSNAVVTVNSDIYVCKVDEPNHSEHEEIAFEDIKLKFNGSYTIYGNGVNLRFGNNVTMEGANYPKVFAGSKSGNKDITKQLKIDINSGTYSEVGISSAPGGANIKDMGIITLNGGQVKKIQTYKVNNKHEQEVYIQLNGGQVDEIIDSNDRNSNNRIMVVVEKNSEVKKLTNMMMTFIGVKGNNVKLTITDNMSGFAIGIKGGCTLELQENVPTVKGEFVYFDDNATIRVPGNRNKNNVPIELGLIPVIAGVLNIELSTDIKQDEFYLLKVNEEELGKEGKYRISEEEHFYLNKIEKVTVGLWSSWYLKGKAKEKGPLIYDTSSKSFKYLDRNKQEQDANWINEKLTNSSINLSNLKYDDLAKHKDHEYYILDPNPIEFIIRGNGSDNTLKFNNDRFQDSGNKKKRDFNIKFQGLNTKKSEFKFENINSLNISGENLITQEIDSKVALTYSFANNGEKKVKFADDKSTFVVHNTNGAQKNEIKKSIENIGTDKDGSIINLSFEESLSSGVKLQLESLDGNGTSKNIPIPTGKNQITMLLNGDNKDYILRDTSDANKRGVYYYHKVKPTDSSSVYEGEIQGELGLKFTARSKETSNYYKVNNKERIYVVSTQTNTKKHYIADTLKKSMESYVAHTGGTHQVIFLGDYTFKNNDANSIKTYSKNTNGITFKSELDGFKYSLNISDDITLEPVTTNRNYPITFANIKFKYGATDKWIYANGRNLTLGDGIEMEGSNYPSISSGKPTTETTVTKSTNLTIKSGTYKDIEKNNDNVDSSTVNIDGGTFKGNVNLAKDSKGDINLNINNGAFEGKVVGVKEGNVTNVNLTIKNGNFKNEVVAVDGNSTASGTIKLTIEGGTFEKIVRGATPVAKTRRIFKSLFNNNGIKNVDVTVKGGTFNDQLQGIALGVNNTKVKLTIENGTFNGNVVTSSKSQNSDITMEIKGGNFSGQVAGQYSDSQGDKAVNVQMNIIGGTFNGEVYASSFADNTTTDVTGGTFNNSSSLAGNKSGNASEIKINTDISISKISEFDNLILGETKQVTLSNFNEINKGNNRNGKGDLELKNGSKISFKNGSKATVNKMKFAGDNNKFSFENNTFSKDNPPIEASAGIESGKVSFEFTNQNNLQNENYLINLGSKMDEDITGKYSIPQGYYVRDKVVDSKNYIVLCKQEEYDLKYSFNDDKLMFAKKQSNGTQTYEDAWWFNKNSNSDITTDNLYKYKGYDLVPNINSNTQRNLTLTGTGSNKTFNFESKLDNINLILDEIKLTDSTLNLSKIRDLKIKGENEIKSMDETNTIFKYVLKSGGTVSKDGNNAHLRILSNKSTDPVNASIESSGSGSLSQGIDFKFNEEVTTSSKVRLEPVNGNSNEKLTFDLEGKTKRLILLLANADKNKGYKLYYGDTGSTGNSVYVAGDTESKFTEEFKTNSNDKLNTYEFVRRAKPINQVKVDFSKNINFTLNADERDNNIDQSNWQKYFTASNIEAENKSLIVKDVFTDAAGKTHEFGRQEIDLKYQFLGVEKNPSNGFELVGNSELNTPPSSSKIKMSLKLINGNKNVEIDENATISEDQSKQWEIKYSQKDTLKIEPNLSNNIFFKIGLGIPNSLTSSHMLKFKFYPQNMTP